MATLVPFSYNEIYQGIASKFKEHGYDIPYEGSNTAILCSILAYTAQAINFNAAVNINESLLTLAKKRTNVVRDARVLSYEPKAKISTQLILTLRYKAAGTFTLKEYQKFTIDGYDYYYTGQDKTYAATSADVDSSTFQITVKQGTLVKNSDLPDELTYTKKADVDYIDIPYDDVENDGLKVIVLEDDSDGQTKETQYKKKEFNVLDISENYENYYFRQDDVETNNCRIFFKLGGFGSDIKEDSTIKVDLLRSDGADTVQTNYSSATIDGDLDDYVEVLTDGDNAIKIAVYGQDEESIESIKKNAPLFYNTAGRCVTYWDYKAFLGSSSAILDGLVWGSEDELVSSAGRIFYSVIPSSQSPKYTVFNGGLENVLKQEADYTESISAVYWNEYNIQNRGSYSSDSSYSELDILRNLNYKNQNTLYVPDNALAGENGIITTIQNYRSPGLLDYIRNPIYFNVDIFVDVKKYEQGLTKGEVHQKIFESIKSYFEERLDYEANYVESALIKSISEIVGSKNGFSVETFLSSSIDSKTPTQGISKNNSNNSNIVLYNLTENEYNYNILLALNKQCQLNDSYTITFNQNVIFNNTTSNSISGNVLSDNLIDENDDSSGKISLNVNLPETSELDIYTNINKNKITARYAEVNMDKTYYTSVLSNNICTIEATILPQLQAGDKYELYYIKDGVLNRITNETISTESEVTTKDAYNFSRDNVLTKTDIKNKKITVTVVCKETNTFNEVVSPDNILIKFVKSQTQELDTISTTYYDSIRCETFEDCQENFERDSRGAYDNYISADNEEFLYTLVNTGTNTYKLTLYITKDFTTGQEITISQGNGLPNTIHILTSDERKLNYVTKELKLSSLKITDVSYKSVSNYPMATLSTDNANEFSTLYREENDALDEGNSSGLENIIEYEAVNTTDGGYSLKESYIITFYQNFYNSFDIRNFVVNYGSGTLDSNGDNSDLQIIVGTESNTNSNIILNHTGNKITSSPTGTGTIELQVNLLQKSTGKVWANTYRINVVESGEDTSELAEGLGGIYMYLDIPPEGIYTDSGDLIEANLPKILGLNIKKQKDLDATEFVQINPTALHTEDAEILQTRDEISGYVYVDTTFDFEELLNSEERETAYKQLKKILPFYSNGQSLAKANAYSWLRFPIYFKSQESETSVQIGTYIIVNSSVPYIRIKFRNSVLLDTITAQTDGVNDLEFEVIYPSSNFSFIKNSCLRLRSVCISTKPENYNLRRAIYDYVRDENNKLSELPEKFEEI